MRQEIVAKMSPEGLAQLRKYIKELFETMWNPAGVAIAVLDRRFPGLEIPDHLREGELPLVLRYDAAPAIPIPDLELREEGISATLSFDRTPRKTFVPWEAIDELCPIVGDAQPQEDPPKKRPKLSLVP